MACGSVICKVMVKDLLRESKDLAFPEYGLASRTGLERLIITVSRNEEGGDSAVVRTSAQLF